MAINIARIIQPVKRWHAFLMQGSRITALLVIVGAVVLGFVIYVAIPPSVSPQELEGELRALPPEFDALLFSGSQFEQLTVEPSPLSPQDVGRASFFPPTETEEIETPASSP